MMTKDYVYLGLILLTALAFYCNGFYAGVYRCKRMYDSLLDDNEEGDGAADTPSASVKILSEPENILAGNPPSREVKVALSTRELRGDFGNN